MKVSIPWLKELVNYKLSPKELADLVSQKTILVKEFNDSFMELDMKGYNRADLLSMRGVASEVAAITDSSVLFEEVLTPDLYWNELTDPEDREYKLRDDLPKLDVDIKDRKLCPVYCLVKITGLKVGPSSEEWVKKLEECGMRSINNIADVTNLVMLEYGQPLHAFDADKVSKKIIVRTARKGEKIRTLDNKERTLEGSDLLITDSKNLLGIAGVMGGKDSEISDSTTTILLEAAIFQPTDIRKTATRLGLVSEAGKRFYHGLTVTRLNQALDHAIKLYQQLGGKDVGFHIEKNNLSQSSDQSADSIRKLTLSLNRTNQLIGVNLTTKEIEDYLKRLGFDFVGQRNTEGDTIWTIEPPYWRLDISIEEDLIEEVARMYGYDRIPPKELQGEKPEKTDQSLFNLIYDLKKALVEEGLTEVQTYSFYSTEVLNNIGFSPNYLNTLVKVANPISSETEYMRMVVWHNLLEVIAKNVKKYSYEDIAIFEIGKMYSPKKDGLPEESYDLAIALMNSTDNPIEELYRILAKALEKVDLKVELGDQDRTSIDNMLFHPTRFQHLVIKGKKNGGIAEVHPRIVNKFGVNQRVAVVELSIEKLIK